MTEDYLNIALFLFGVGASAICWYAGWRSLYLDKYRQSLFELRDQLFDVARDGKIPFDDPLYGKMRNAIHLRIRFAHRFAFSDLILTNYLVKRFRIEVKDFYAERLKLIAALPDPELRTQLREIEENANRLTISYFYRASALLRFIVGPIFSLLLAIRIVREGYKRKLNIEITRRVILMDNASESDDGGPMLAW